jgi:ABC-type iron transport system FetAB permease component
MFSDRVILRLVVLSYILKYHLKLHDAVALFNFYDVV